MKPYDLKKIVHIHRVDHPESISVGPDGTAFTTGTGGQIYRLDLIHNVAVQFASTAPRRILGQAVDANGNLYCADTTGKVICITPQGEETVYATGPHGSTFRCINYPVFDRLGHLYVSDSGDWSETINGHIYKVPPGGGSARLWFPEPINTPNAMALDVEEKFIYVVETLGSGIARIAIHPDGPAGAFERVLHLPRTVPDGIAFDEDGRLWIAFHRPDAIWVFDLRTRHLNLFAEDWRGMMLRGPTDVAFAGANRDILLASSLDNLVVHRFDGIGVRGLRLNNPNL